MYWDNVVKVTMKNEETAAAALKIIKARLANGFECDKEYEWNASSEMHDALNVIDNSIVLPEGFAIYRYEELEIVVSELMQHLAQALITEDFTFFTGYYSDCDEGWVNGHYKNGELKIKTTFLPFGFCDCDCPECGEVIATIGDDAEGNLYIDGKLFTGEVTNVCPECGEEIDLSDWLPVILEKTIKIV